MGVRIRTFSECLWTKWFNMEDEKSSIYKQQLQIKRGGGNTVGHPFPPLGFSWSDFNFHSVQTSTAERMGKLKSSTFGQQQLEKAALVLCLHFQWMWQDFLWRYIVVLLAIMGYLCYKVFWSQTEMQETEKCSVAKKKGARQRGCLSEFIF